MLYNYINQNKNTKEMFCHNSFFHLVNQAIQQLGNYLLVMLHTIAQQIEKFKKRIFKKSIKILTEIKH